MKIQSGWAVDTNLIARRQLYETFVDKNSANENYFFPYFQLIIWITVYPQHLQQHFQKWQQGFSPIVRKQICYLREVQKALLSWQQPEMAWYGPHPSTCRKRYFRSHPTLCWIVCFACSCREPALNFSGQFCKHLGLISAWAEHKSSDSTWTAATARTHFKTDMLRAHFSLLHPELFVSSKSAIKIGMTTVNDNLFSSLLGIQQLQSWLQAYSKP